MTTVPDKLAVISWFTFLECLRSRTLWVAALITCTAFFLAFFVGKLAIIETRQMQAAAMAVFVRSAAVVLVALMVIGSMVREVQEKRMELALAFAIGRGTYLLGKLAGFALAALAIVMLVMLPFWFYVPAGQTLIWGTSLALELLIVVVLSFLCVQTLSQMTLSFVVVIGFYVLSRGMHAVQLIGKGALFDQEALAQGGINLVLDGIAYILPGLNYFAVTDWLVYHTATAGDLLPVVVQSMVYLGLLVSAALFDLHRKSL